MRQKKKAQDSLVYAVLIAAIATALVIMSGYIQRRVQGVYQSTGDAIGGGEIKN